MGENLEGKARAKGQSIAWPSLFAAQFNAFSVAEIIAGDKEQCPRQGQDNHWSSSQPPTNNPDLAQPLINFEDHRFDNLTLLTTNSYLYLYPHLGRRHNMAVLFVNISNKSHEQCCQRLSSTALLILAYRPNEKDNKDSFEKSLQKSLDL